MDEDLVAWVAEVADWFDEVGFVVTVSSSALRCPRRESHAAQGVHFTLMLPRRLGVVATARTIAQPLEGSPPLECRYDRSGRALDGGGRYRRGPPTRVRLESEPGNPTLVPINPPRLGAFVLCGDEPLSRGAQLEVGRNCAGLRGLVRTLRIRQLAPGLVFLRSPQVERGLCAKVERPHAAQSECSAVIASARLPVVSAD
jgi:hypothetical protein